MSTVHPYLRGYSVLPQLRRIGVDEVFNVTDDELIEFRELKRAVRSSQVWHVEDDCPDEVKQAARDFIVAHYPHPLTHTQTLEDVAFDVAEEIIVHRLSRDRDWMALGYVFYPSSWLPEEKVGRSFREIHEPVPGMDLSRSRQYVEAMIHAGPFERFVWSPLFERRLNCHPRYPRAAFNPARPVLFIKVERQVTVGLPEHGALLFLLKQSLIPQAEIDKRALARAIEGMTPDQREYKGIGGCFAELTTWLEDESISDQ